MADCPVCGNKAKVIKTIPLSTGRRKWWECDYCGFDFTGEAIVKVEEVVDKDCLLRAEWIREGAG